MRIVTDRTRDAVVINVILVPAPRDRLHDHVEVVTLGAHSVGTVNGQIGQRIQVDRDGSSRAARSLTAFVVALEDVPILRAMRTVRSGAAKFAVVVTVVAIGTQDLRAHRPAMRRASL